MSRDLLTTASATVLMKQGFLKDKPELTLRRCVCTARTLVIPGKAPHYAARVCPRCGIHEWIAKPKRNCPPRGKPTVQEPPTVLQLALMEKLGVTAESKREAIGVIRRALAEQRANKS
jgi:hypothetical protein